MLSKVKERKGSTLILVMIYMMVLSMLGTTILSVAVANYRMKKEDVKMKKALYSAESGIEEAAAIIEKTVKAAIKAANDKVEYNLDNDIDEDYYTSEVLDEEGNVVDVVINENKLKIAMEFWFENEYKDYINEELNDAIEAFESYKAYDVFNNDISVDTDEEDPFTVETIIPDDPDDEDEYYVIKVTSKYEDDSSLSRRVSKLFTVGIPKYDQPYYQETYYYNLDNLKVDDFIDNIITAQGDIFIEENADVTAESGNIYAYGGEEEVDVENEGIAVIGGSLTVESGNVMTRKYLKAYSDNSNINIMGDLYCNSLVVDYDAENATIRVGEEAGAQDKKFRVFTEDDIELNGTNSAIEIYGSYYGFAVGITSHAHDQSSAIVINSNDIGTSSKLIISGEASDHDYSYSDAEGTHTLPGIILGGTAYMNFDNARYQTGESVSLTGNYLACEKTVVPGLIDRVNDSLGEAINTVEYGTYEGNGSEVQLADTYNGTESLTAKTKGEFLAQSIPGVDFNVKVGWDSDLEKGIKLSNVLYSTGAYISNGTVFNDKKGYLNFSDAIADLKDEYDDKIQQITISEEYENPGVKITEYNSEEDELCFISASKDDISIVGNSGSKPTADYSYEVGNRVKGIIITGGDVYITGEVEFEGIIAAEGNVYFKDNSSKILRLNKNIEIKSSSSVFGTEEGLENYIDTSSLIKASSWEKGY